MFLKEVINKANNYGVPVSQSTITRLTKKGFSDVDNFNPSEAQHYGKTFEYSDQAPLQVVIAHYMRKLTTATDSQINYVRKVTLQDSSYAEITSIEDFYLDRCRMVTSGPPEETLGEDHNFRFLVAYIFFRKLIQGEKMFLTNLHTDWTFLKELLAFGEAPVLRTTKQCSVPLISKNSIDVKSELTGLFENAFQLTTLINLFPTIEEWISWSEIYTFFEKKDWIIDHIVQIIPHGDYRKIDIQRMLSVVSAFSLSQ